MGYSPGHTCWITPLFTNKYQLTMKKYLILVLTLLLFADSSLAQIRISAIKVDDWVKKNFSGQGVIIGNVSFKGYPLSTLSFTSAGNVLQVPRGLLLSTGNSYNVAGFNNSHNQSSTFGDILVPQNDADLAAIISGKLYDICSIEFDFVPMDNSIQFNYQFGSDEYPEYVDSPYNDVFAFIVSDGGSSRNIALIPGSGVPVSINTVNFKLNSEHFIDNNLYKQVVIKRQEPVKSTYRGTLPGRVLRGVASIFSVSTNAGGDRVVIQPDAELMKTLDPNLYRNLRYDGITKKLVAQTFVTPYKKYHLKIVIADVSDNIYDSGVFIEDRSLSSKKDILQPGFIDYPDLSKVIDPNLILQGKTLEEILPAQYKNVVPRPLDQAPAIVQQPASAPIQQAVAAEPEKRVSAAVITEIQNAVILFDFDKSDISDSEMQKLRNAIDRFKGARQHYSMKISGHTDNKGSLKYNYDLSARRNQSVIDAVRHLLGENILIPSASKSYTQPVEDNSTDSGRQANRRVEIVFVKKD